MEQLNIKASTLANDLINKLEQCSDHSLFDFYTALNVVKYEIDSRMELSQDKLTNEELESLMFNE